MEQRVRKVSQEKLTTQQRADIYRVKVMSMNPFRKARHRAAAKPTIEPLTYWSLWLVVLVLALALGYFLLG